jgi:hypothetical protein
VKDEGDSNGPAVPIGGGGVGAITLAPVAPFRSCTVATFLTRAADACSRCCAAAASLSSRRIAAHVGLGMNLGVEIQLYERKKIARIGRFRGHLPVRMPGRGESRLCRGSTTAVVQRCWSRLFLRWSTRPRCPLTKGRRGRLRERTGSYVKKSSYVDGVETIVVGTLIKYPNPHEVEVE